MEYVVKKNAFVFPGQGSQFIGMGFDLFKNYNIAKEMYLHANEILEFDLTEISFKDSLNRLNRTLYTQPAIFVNSAIIYKLLEKHINPNCVAGHSLGEITALYASKSLTFEEALILVKKRAMLMEKCNEKYKGGMLVVLNPTQEKLDKLCDQDGTIVIANYNSSQQTIISGEKKCIELALKIAKKNNIVAKKINVSGAFHSPLMYEAQVELSKTISSFNFKSPEIPVYQNLTGDSTMNLERIKHNLTNQIQSPVLWEKTIQKMNENNIESFYEIGPKNILISLIKKILNNPITYSVQKKEDIENHERKNY